MTDLQVNVDLRVNVDPRLSVIVPCHDLRGFDLLTDTVKSAQRQSPAPARIVVAVDHNEELFQRAKRELTGPDATAGPGVTVIRNRHRRGVSGNRNSGAELADTELLAFLDGDTLAQPGWLAGLVAPFEDPDVIGSGGAIDALWRRRPTWVPDEFLWAYGGSHAGLPAEPSPVRNVWSANMAVRANGFWKVGGFNLEFGKVGERSRPEDTEFCLRVAEGTGGHWQYIPDARVHHIVPRANETMRYFLTRCFNEGRGKVAMARLLSGRASLGPERSYLRQTLPRAMQRDLADALSGRDRTGANRAGAVVVGVVAAGVGAVVELGTRKGGGPL